MSSRPRSSRKPSSFLLTLRLSSRRCWTSWRLKRLAKSLAREQRRTLLLGQALDSSLLRQKELEQLHQQAQHRLAEMADSQAFRAQPTPPQLLPPPEQETHLSRLLTQDSTP